LKAGSVSSTRVIETRCVGGYRPPNPTIAGSRRPMSSRRRPGFALTSALGLFVLMDSRALPHGVLIVVLPIVALNLLDAFLTLWHIELGAIEAPGRGSARRALRRSSTRWASPDAAGMEDPRALTVTQIEAAK
jgi:hypothetical protein